MKKNIIITCLVMAFTLFHISHSAAQEPGKQEAELIDLRIDLAASKLELLDSRMKLLEEKPVVLDGKLADIEDRMAQIESVPALLQEKYTALDSLEVVQQELLKELNEISNRLQLMEKNTSAGPGTISFTNAGAYTPGKYVISMLPVRLFEGTMELAVERVLNKGNALELSAMATYASKKGFARYYLANQKLEYYNADRADYLPYSSENITGFGGSVAWKNYLLARTDVSYSAPGGPYVAPMGMFRRLTLSGFDHIYNEEEEIYETVEVIQYLNVFSGGFLAGWQFVFWDVVTADVYLGGMIRLSKYDGEEGFTKYKALQNVDFSGVLPTIGIKLGIVK
ncbi:MAG: hypothetical protein P1P82_07670 [Bacteroidales bacterium]|nr:hypothetical protein [Bacteroidales bacterium]MDT8430410.1 hypothetical protein [Bacteroidales bacterium]